MSEIEDKEMNILKKMISALFHIKKDSDSRFNSISRDIRMLQRFADDSLEKARLKRAGMNGDDKWFLKDGLKDKDS